jgi:hypothetical protein
MRALVETALCLALALTIAFLVFVPLHRPRPLPDRLELTNLSFVFLAISPIGAALLTCGLIVLFGAFAAVLRAIGWLASYDLLDGAKATFFQYAPPVFHGARSWQVMIAIYLFCLTTLLARGIRVLLRHGRAS